VIKAKLLALLGLLAVLCLLSVAIGARQIPPTEVIKALRSHDPPDVDAIVSGSRVPRTALGLLVGVALGLAGAIMQALTRNPLADPGLLGISAGAAFGVVIAVAWLGFTSLYGYIWFAFAAALITSVVVYLLGRGGRIRRLPPPLSAWTSARDAPQPPAQTFRDWWRTGHGDTGHGDTGHGEAR